MERKSFVWLLVVSLFAGCLSQSQPTPPPSSTSVNRPPIADFSHNWTGGDKEQPWTCSKITFKADVSDPDGDKINSIMWYDNGNPIWKCSNSASCETKFWPDGTHTIQLKATDAKGAQSVLEKQIDVKYEVPEPIPLQTKNGVNIVTIDTTTGVEAQTHPADAWTMSTYMPLLGFYDMTNPVTIDWHIKWALEHGINTLWIFATPHGNPPETVNAGSNMTYYRDGFLKAKYKDKIKFNVMLDTTMYNPYSSNYEPKDSIEKDIEILSKYYFTQPNYYKINGKPILYAVASDQYLCDDCKDKSERESVLKSHIKIIREIAKKNGYDIFLIGDRSSSFSEHNVDEFMTKQFDAITSYNLLSARDPEKYKWTLDEKGRRLLIAPYEDLVAAGMTRESELTELAKKNDKIYIPFVEQGFNNEKRFNAGYRDWMVKRTAPTPEKFEEFVTKVKPLIDSKVNTLLTTWNEFCEGNAIEPTKEFGFDYSNIMRDNFAIKPTNGWPPNIVPTKNCGCTEYKNWRTEIGIPGIGGVVAVSENGLLKALVRRRKEGYSKL